jgi:hypothetical protein
MITTWLLAAASAGAGPPGVVIGHVPAATRTYVGSPSLAILPDGSYVACHDLFGPASSEWQGAVTRVFRSPNRGKPASIRNTLVLMRSHDLRRWEPRSIVLHHPDTLKHGFQYVDWYVDWLFDGDDLVAACRTAHDDAQGGAHRAHDANYLTFHRLERFRERSWADSVVDPATLGWPPARIERDVVVSGPAQRALHRGRRPADRPRLLRRPARQDACHRPARGSRLALFGGLLPAGRLQPVAGLAAHRPPPRHAPDLGPAHALPHARPSNRHAAAVLQAARRAASDRRSRHGRRRPGDDAGGTPRSLSHARRAGRAAAAGRTRGAMPRAAPAGSGR